MRAYLFPGQGSQCRGMGKELFALFPDYTAQANELLGYSIEALCVEDAQQQLNKTEYTQPALYIVNALTYLSLIKETNQKPDYVAGHSLGEYNALFAAEAFDFITGLTLVQKRGELMSKAKGGAMAAVLGLSFAQLTHILEEHQLTTITVANYNSYQQLVISGPKITMEQVGSLLTSLKDVTFIPLSVSGAFHSPYMLEAQQNFATFLNGFEFKTPCLPVISNINAKPYHPGVTKINLVNQITHAVEWKKTIEYLQTKPNMSFTEVGPGTVLTGLIRRINNKQ